MKRLGLMIAALVAVVFASCDHRDLCYDHSHWVDLTVDFDWSAEPDAQPSTMVFYLFPIDGSEGIRYELTRTDGPSTIRVPSGDFHAVTFNGNTETLRESGNGWGNFMIASVEQEILEPMNRTFAVVPSSPPRVEGTDGQPVKAVPATLWADKSENFTIIPGETGQSITFTPRLKTTLYRVVINNVENLTDQIGISATLTSMAEGYSPRTDACHGVDVTVPMGLQIAGADKLAGVAEMFGHCPDSRTDRRHILTVYTSNKFYYNFDVTDQVHSAENRKEVVIVIDKLKLPHPDETGMSPSVGDWSETIDNVIEMQ